jgi:methylmalonyl-CoA/ethylmalonyl-CoA epimerase
MNPQINPVFNNKNYHHVGVIVKDIDKTIDFLSSLGIGPFAGRDGKRWFDVSFKGEFRGKAGQWSVKISNAPMGNGQLELLQPSGGQSALQEYLDKHGEGLHHIGYVTDDLQGDVKKLAAMGIKVLTSAVTERGGFAYFETGVPGGVVTELRGR